VMPSIYDLKPRFQSLLRPIITRLARWGLTPNAITLIAVIGSILTGVLVAIAGPQPLSLLMLPAWLFFRMALNAIDGMMARELGMATQLGAVLNEIGDAVSDLGLYLPLAFLYPKAQWPVIAFSIGAVLTEFCGLLGRALGATRRYDGPMGKSDRAFVIGALGLFTAISSGLLELWPFILSAAALLTLVTCLNRVSKALKELPEK